MKSIEMPDTHTVYMLLRQSGLSFVPTSSSVTNSTQLGTGFFLTKIEAEQHRTMEILKLSATDNTVFHIFELEVPNIVKGK
jgi:hypothetical protein